jgi:hypothetical protein
MRDDLPDQGESTKPARSVAARAGKGCLFGLVVGWLVGMLWWTWLMYSFGTSVAVESSGGRHQERLITPLDRLPAAPYVAIPWGVVGAIVGGVSGLMASRLALIAACCGTAAGVLFTMATNPFDGWLVLTMPVNCLGGTLTGLLIGGTMKFFFSAYRGWIGRPPANVQ